MTWRKHLSALWPWLLAVLAVVGFGAAAGHPFHDMRCAMLVPDVDPMPRRSRLLGCSNIEQRPQATAAQDLPADVPGWNMYTPKEGGETRILVTLNKYCDRVVFYPRLSGEDASITVDEPLGAFRKKLFSLSGRKGQWTPVGAQYTICLGCVEDGWSAEEFPLTLEIVLRGRGSQLWHKGDLIFFEAP